MVYTCLRGILEQRLRDSYLMILQLQRGRGWGGCSQIRGFTCHEERTKLLFWKTAFFLFCRRRVRQIKHNFVYGTGTASLFVAPAPTASDPSFQFNVFRFKKNITSSETIVTIPAYIISWSRINVYLDLEP
jgi:hypothetical protein